MIDFKIDKKKCIKCGLCAQECPVLIIDGKTEYPEIKEGKEKQCIKCQHCLAVCPTAALSIWGKNPEDSIPVTDELPTPEDMERLIKTRRSIRKFKKEEINQELIQKLLETAAYAPTGHNKNSVLFSVTDSKEQLNKLRTAVYDGIKRAGDAGTLPETMAFLGDLQRLWDSKQIDVLFRDAPHVLITSAPKNVASPDADCHIALSYFELLANTYRVGTLWNGFIKMVLKDIAPGIGRQIGIPEDHVIGYVLLFGKPAVKFTRSVQSEGLNLNRIEL
ncbi:nitroreductase family protein [Prolixibacteraceae bacterium Z1-6]|uniref:Nitroreductase family protein n=1 Tax=Draconibacterium aestuarii TaxID=2998507 RepID=A0A9X3F9G9_9BACT|nr:nitroreductase family protein [Prolixibacteraceae bacterium Z1-6]